MEGLGDIRAAGGRGGAVLGTSGPPEARRGLEDLVGAGRRKRGGPGDVWAAGGLGGLGTSEPQEARRGLEDFLGAGRWEGAVPGDVLAAGGRKVGLNIPTRRFWNVCQERTGWLRSGTGVVNPAKRVKRVDGVCFTDLTFLEWEDLTGNCSLLLIRREAEGTIIMNSPDTSFAFKCQVIWKEKPKGFSATSSYVEKGRKMYLSERKEN